MWPKIASPRMAHGHDSRMLIPTKFNRNKHDAENSAEKCNKNEFYDSIKVELENTWKESIAKLNFWFHMMQALTLLRSPGDASKKYWRIAFRVTRKIMLCGWEWKLSQDYFCTLFLSFRCKVAMQRAGTQIPWLIEAAEKNLPVVIVQWVSLRGWRSSWIAERWIYDASHGLVPVEFYCFLKKGKWPRLQWNLGSRIICSRKIKLNCISVGM